MTTVDSKPFGKALVPGTLAPLTFFAAALLADAVRCGIAHATFAALFAGFIVVPFLAAIGAAATVLTVGLWNGRFPLGRFRVACGIVAALATLAGIAFIAHDPSSTFCRIDL
ncbi:MAG TPA: hypothetical protein VHT53_09995 [Candidatus Elarobacter sp.]|jgi:hypothetical protein|nr:hypothetical protein [Candidatus Elarobacter sp.]